MVAKRQRIAGSNGGEQSGHRSLVKTIASGWQADSSVIDVTPIRLASRKLANFLNTTRAYVTMVDLCEHATRGIKEHFYLSRVLVLAKSLRDLNSSYPLVVVIVDQAECSTIADYDERFIPELNIKFTRLPTDLFKVEDLPERHGGWRLNFPKAYFFAMDAFERLVYLEPDLLPLRNSDDLFDLPEPRKVRLNTLQWDCTQHPFDRNDLGTVNFLMVLQPRVVDFNAITYRYLMAREHKEATDSALTMQQLFSEQSRLVKMPPADLLETDCLAEYKCDMDAVRLLRLGGVGNTILSHMIIQGPMLADVDQAWQPAFQKWSDRCFSADVRKACNGRCHGHCAMTVAWKCKSC